VLLAHRFRDLGLYNFALDDVGDILVLDPPPAATRVLDVAGRDVAWFMASIAGSMARGRHGWAGGPVIRVAEYLQVRGAILGHLRDGYGLASGTVLGNADLRLAALLEASFLVARAARRSRRAPRHALFLGLVARAARDEASGRRNAVVPDHAEG
jgi:hypothetical protein